MPLNNVIKVFFINTMHLWRTEQRLEDHTPSEIKIMQRLFLFDKLLM